MIRESIRFLRTDGHSSGNARNPLETSSDIYDFDETVISSDENVNESTSRFSKLVVYQIALAALALIIVIGLCAKKQARDDKDTVSETAKPSSSSENSKPASILKTPKYSPAVIPVESNERTKPVYHQPKKKFLCLDDRDPTNSSTTGLDEDEIEDSVPSFVQDRFGSLSSDPMRISDFVNNDNTAISSDSDSISDVL